MQLGEARKIGKGSCELRGIVDGRYIVRVRNSRLNVETYEVWTEEKLTTLAQQEDKQERNRQIYERKLAGETYADLGRDFGLSSGRVSQIFARQKRMNR